MSLNYEISTEPLQISAKQLFLMQAGAREVRAVSDLVTALVLLRFVSLQPVVPSLPHFVLSLPRFRPSLPPFVPS